MAKVKTAIEEANDMFQRLRDMKINRPPLPKSEMQQYSVAALPWGKVLLSTGKTKVSPATRKVEKAKRAEGESMAPIGKNKGRTSATISDLLLQIAIPERQIGTGGSKTFAFANFMNQMLRPQMPTSPEIGAPALLPGPRATQKFYRPSALANLPPTVKSVESQFEQPLEKYGTFLENTDKIQKELAKRFLAQFNRGERAAAYAAMGGRGRTPGLISQYQGKYSLPAPRSATSATIRPQVPTFNAARIS